MKATLDETGMLIVSAETALEAYALKQYSNSINWYSNTEEPFPLCIETELKQP